MLKDFKTFILRGNVVDLAVGIIIGAAFTSIVTSMVHDILMPPIGYAIGNVDFSDLFLVIKHGAMAGPYANLAAAKAAGAVTWNYGLFINALIAFLITAFATFLLVRAVNRLHRNEAAKPEPQKATKECPYCLSAVPVKATRCAHCTSSLSPA